MTVRAIHRERGYGKASRKSEVMVLEQVFRRLQRIAARHAALGLAAAIEATPGTAVSPVNEMFAARRSEQLLAEVVVVAMASGHRQKPSSNFHCPGLTHWTEWPSVPMDVRVGKDMAAKHDWHSNLAPTWEARSRYDILLVILLIVQE